jgi:coenzyme F420-dependent glucose-6-phosphate dehydrogenase
MCYESRPNRPGEQSPCSSSDTRHPPNNSRRPSCSISLCWLKRPASIQLSSDHFQPWKHVDGHAPSSLVWLGALGARTSKLVMGTSVLTPTFRYHPSIVAQAFGTLGSMFPGRVILGIGTGESLNEVPSTGAPWPEFKERFARMREAVTLIRTLWRGERISFEGEYYKTEKATIYDRPEQEIPIYVAAAGAVVARYAGRTGDGFICTM